MIRYINKPTEIIDEMREKVHNLESLCVWWVDKEGNYGIRSFMMPEEAPLHLGICDVAKEHILNKYVRDIDG